MEKEEILQRILIGNIISMSKGFNYTVEEKIKCWLNLQSTYANIKGLKHVGFVGQGVGAITAAPDVLAALIKNPATDAAIADQNRDFGFLVGERRTWLDLVNDK